MSNCVGFKSVWAAVRLLLIGVTFEVVKSCEDPPGKVRVGENDLMNDRLPIPQNENGRDLNGFGEMI
jgi:hypothetical protein